MIELWSPPTVRTSETLIDAHRVALLVVDARVAQLLHASGVARAHRVEQWRVNHPVTTHLVSDDVPHERVHDAHPRQDRVGWYSLRGDGGAKQQHLGGQGSTPTAGASRICPWVRGPEASVSRPLRWQVLGPCSSGVTEASPGWRCYPFQPTGLCTSCVHTALANARGVLVYQCHRSCRHASHIAAAGELSPLHLSLFGQGADAARCALSTQSQIPVAEQRLIYKGRVLKDEQTIEAIGAYIKKSLRELYAEALLPPRGDDHDHQCAAPHSFDAISVASALSSQRDGGRAGFQVRPN